MANSYSEGTGVLILDKVTPVIEALFRPLQLDGTYPGEGAAQITISSEDETFSWKDVHKNLPPLLRSLSLETRYLSEDDLVPALRLLADHFRLEDDPIIQDIFKNYRFEGKVELDTLFRIAVRFNDGHNLKAIKLESGQWCTRPALFAFGGAGFFVSEKVCTSSSSTDVLSLGGDLDTAIRLGDLDKGAMRIVDEVQKILNAVSDPRVRNSLHWRVADRLLASYQDVTRRH